MKFKKSDKIRAISIARSARKLDSTQEEESFGVKFEYKQKLFEKLLANKKERQKEKAKYE